MWLLTTHCPRCNVLKKKLDAKGCLYEEVTDENEIKEYGIYSVPALVLDDDTIMDFTHAVKYINSL